jgi:hypothetical protein
MPAWGAKNAAARRLTALVLLASGALAALPASTIGASAAPGLLSVSIGDGGGTTGSPGITVPAGNQTVGVKAPSSASVSASPDLGISIGGKPVIEIGVTIPETPITPPIKVPEVEVSVGGGSSSEPQLVGVSVEGQPLIQVPAPKAPSLPVETPTTPNVPTVPETTSGAGGKVVTNAPNASSTSTESASGSPAAGGSVDQPSLERPGNESGDSTASRSSGATRSGRRTSAASSTVGPSASTPGNETTGSVGHVGQDAAFSTSKQSNNLLTVLGRNLPLPVPDWSKPIILLLLLVAAFFAARLWLASRRTRRLEVERTELLRDVDAMQEALVPEAPSHLGGLAISVAYRPAEGPAAGGDFYDVFRTTDGKVAIILGDVAGHGIGSLKHAALTHYTLRAYVQAGLEPRAALALAGRALADPSGELLATVVVGVYDSEQSAFTYALAGHPPPLLTGTPAKDSITICSSPPIGWTVPTGRRQRTISLPGGAQVCFFSDGLIEARCAGTQGHDTLLGRERLADLLAALGPKPAASNLLGLVRKAATATPDDMAACILTSEASVDIADVDTEELEVDHGTLASGSVRELLEASGVDDANSAATIQRAASIATAHETAIVRIEHFRDGTARASAEQPHQTDVAEEIAQQADAPSPHRLTV